MKISCKMCGANLKFVPSIQKACCEHCGNVHKIKEIEYDDSIYDECEQYTCSSCGAELLSFGKTGVVSCVYCGGKEFVKGKANKEYILQGIFPFKVDRNQFIKSYEEYFKTLSDVDEEFRKKVKEANVTSLYLPYSFANNFFRKQYSKELNDLLEEIIPFDFKELKNMNPIYFDNCLAEIVKTKKEENDIKTNAPDFYWVPIWLAEIEFESRIYYIVMNGQTWELAGYYSKMTDVSSKNKKYIKFRKIIKKIGRMLEILLAIVLFYSIANRRSF